jgi:hypothetical protein
MKTPIDLGQEYGKLGIPMSMDSTADEKHYPSFHYEGDEELGLPETGTMTIKFCVRREVSGKRESGKHYYECDISVEKILSVKGQKSEEAPARSGSDAADALDKLAEALGAKDSDDDGDEY